MAIGASSATEPADLLLALRGSGQALYVGLAEDAFIVASEPYGVVEETDRYLRLDGETPGRPRPTRTPPAASSSDSRGALAGTIEGIERLAYDGTPLPVARRRAGHRPDHDPRHRPGRRPALPAQGDHRGAGLVPQDPAGQAGRPRRAPAGAWWATTRLPDDLRARPARPGVIRRILVIGQGTAAVAGQSLAAALARRSGRRPPSRSGRCWPPSCPASSWPPTCPTRWWWPSASRAPPPTPTARSTWCGPGAVGWWPWSTAATAT